MPPTGTVVARRRTTGLQGLGLVDGVSDDAWIAIARAEAAVDPDAAGRVSIVLLDFNPTPAMNDDGRDVDALTDFQRFLAPPARGAITDEVLAGERVFAEIGCATCHLPSLTTAANAVAALSRVTFHPYSDFLLHDMGALGDGIAQGQARPADMRTAPLWGLRSAGRLLHDGSANRIEQAILRHDGLMFLILYLTAQA